MMKQQIIDMVLECTKKLERVPSHSELMQMTELSAKQIRWHFRSYSRLLRECGLERAGCGNRVDMDRLFRDWAAIVRELKKLPTTNEYINMSHYSVRPLITRFANWGQVPYGLKQQAEEHGWAEEWKDVMDIIVAQGRDIRKGATTSTGEGPQRACRERLDREIYGPLMRKSPLMCAPTNEQGVIFLFGAMAENLGFAVLRIRTEYPDCEAFRQLDEDRWERLKIEFEYESRNFLKHMHEPRHCDMIVCWRHNWPECPLEVVELKTAIAKNATIAKIAENENQIL